jgi:hypothetical protein
MGLFMKYENSRWLPSREERLNDAIMAFIIPEAQNTGRDMRL